MNQAPFQTRPQGAFRMHAQQSHPRIRESEQYGKARAPRETFVTNTAPGNTRPPPPRATACTHDTPSRARPGAGPMARDNPPCPQPLGTTQARRLVTQKVGDNAGLCTALVHKGSTGNESRNARFRRFAPRPREPHADDAATPEKTTLFIGKIESTFSIFATFWLHGLEAS